MYGKIFQSMYDGTIAANWKALVTFQQMIILSDADGIIDITPPALTKRTGIPLEIIEEGIKFLEEPDPYSRSQDHEGRRIIRVDEHRPWGWIIVNHEYYRDLASVDDKREKARIRKQKQRAKGSEKGDVTPCHTSSRMSRHTDTDADTNTLEAFNSFWQHYPKKRNKGQARKAWLKLSPDKPLIKKILQAVEVAKESDDWQKEKGKYIPYPATWLNAEGWEDHHGSEDDDPFRGAL